MFSNISTSSVKVTPETVAGAVFVLNSYLNYTIIFRNYLWNKFRCNFYTRKIVPIRRSLKCLCKLFVPVNLSSSKISKTKIKQPWRPLLHCCTDTQHDDIQARRHTVSSFTTFYTRYKPGTCYSHLQQLDIVLESWCIGRWTNQLPTSSVPSNK